MMILKRVLQKSSQQLILRRSYRCIFFSYTSSTPLSTAPALTVRRPAYFFCWRSFFLDPCVLLLRTLLYQRAGCLMLRRSTFSAIPTMQQLHHSNSACVSPEETIGVLQAASIIEVVQNGTNNVETRRRLRIKRHPWYAAVLRSYGLFQVSGIDRLDDSITGQSKWQSFHS